MIPSITTYTGKKINPLDVDPDLICIEDIAHALALCNRFAGHTKVPMSVAQHSIHVSRLCFFHHALQGLLHDASEAYLGDVTKWVKQTPELEGFRKIEDKLQRIIYTKYGCEGTTTPIVEYADKFMVRIEAQWGMSVYPIDHPEYPPPHTDEELHKVRSYHAWSWKQAERKFLVEFEVLTSGGKRKRIGSRGEI